MLEYLRLKLALADRKVELAKLKKERVELDIQYAKIQIEMESILNARKSDRKEV